MYGIGREAQDAFALESQRRAQAALAQGVFEQETVGVELRRGGGVEVVIADEAPRADVTLERLARLRARVRATGHGDGRHVERHQ